MAHIELRPDGLFRVQDIFGKALIRQVVRGWHVLFQDSEGHKRFGHVLNIDLEQHQLQILDDVAHPNSPSPFNAERKTIPFDVVMFAEPGFTGLRDEIFDAKRKIGWRNINIIAEGSERETTVGWIDRRGGRAYVDVDPMGERWQLRRGGEQ